MEVTFMKTKIATAIVSLVSALGFAQEAPIAQPSASFPTERKMSDQPASKGSFSYVRMGIADSDAINQFETLPGLGLGYRWALGNGALDVSANYTRELKKADTENYFYTAPKVSYLHYWNSASNQSLYLGAGLSWSGIKKEVAANNFDGIAPSATVGFEMNRHQAVRTFAQLDVYQPAMAITRSSISFDNLPGPLAEVSVGLGF
jgi:hypothetical protein